VKIAVILRWVLLLVVLVNREEIIVIIIVSPTASCDKYVLPSKLRWILEVVCCSSEACSFLQMEGVSTSLTPNRVVAGEGQDMQVKSSTRTQN